MLVGRAFMLEGDPIPAFGVQHLGFSDSTQYAKLKQMCQANKQKFTFARIKVPVHDTTTIFIFFIEMQMATICKPK